MKKVISLCLVLVMVFTTCVPCYAADEASEENSRTNIVDASGNTLGWELLPVEGTENQFVFNYYVNGQIHTEYHITKGEDTITAIPRYENARSNSVDTYQVNVSDYVAVGNRENVETEFATTYGVRFGRIDYNYSPDADATFYAILTSNGATTYREVIDVNADRGDLLGDVAGSFAALLIEAGIMVANLATGVSGLVVTFVLTQMGALSVNNIVQFAVSEEVDCVTTEYDISVTMDSDDTLSGVVFDTYETTGYQYRFLYEDSPVEVEYEGIAPYNTDTWQNRDVARRIWIETIYFPANYDFPGVDAYIDL